MPAYDEDRWVLNADGSRSRATLSDSELAAAAQTTTTTTDADEDEEIDATDAAVALAEQAGIDLATVAGTGADGRITKADVEALVEED